MKSVYLSGSNQFENIGVGNYGTEAYRMDLIADKVQNILESRVVTCFRSENTWTLSKIVKDSNSKKPTIHVAIHSNANQGNDRGSEVFCHQFGFEGEKLARAIYNQLEPLTPTKDRGVKEGKNFYGNTSMYELENTDSPAVLIEIAFHDNKDDAEFIVTHLDEIANAIAVGILYYLNIPLEIAKTFNDQSNISNWALEAVNHLAKLGIIVGDGNNNFNPQNIATREQVAVMLSKALKYLGK